MYLFCKRFFDVLFSSILIIMLSPIFLIIVFVLILFNSGEVLFVQKRIGYKNLEFKMFKFATMLKNSKDLPGGSITMRNDPRVSKIGGILRITKLNELPQFFNVLNGSMSFVGPRPMLMEGFDLYDKEAQAIMFLSKPGITGISSVIFRDEEKWVTEAVDISPKDFYIERIFPYKGQLEEWYFKKKSFLVDFLILILTLVKIVLPGSNLEFKLFTTLPKSDYFNFERN